MKTAVLLSGYMRTWHICKDALIDGLTTVYGSDIDWFVMFWDTKTSTISDVRRFFVSKSLNLVHLEFVNQSMNLLFEKGKVNDSMWQITDSITGPAYLRQKLSKIKRLYEYKNGIIYDRVIYSRPDIIYYFNPRAVEKENEIIGDIKDFAMQIRGDFNETSYELMAPSTHDLMPIAGSLSSDLYGFMYIDANNSYTGVKALNLRNGETHSWTSIYLSRHLISRDARAKHNALVSYITPIVIRPTSDINKFLSGYKNWDLNWLPAAEHDQFWMRRDNFDEKIKYCESMNIDIDDYGLGRFVDHE